jgi:hypothetical protein
VDYTAGTVSDKNHITVAADSWNYDQVRLVVTRVGSGSGDTLNIGYSSEKTFDIYRRLQTIAAPSVSLDAESSSGLNYTIKWSAMDSADVCGGYRVFILCDGVTSELTTELVQSESGKNSYSINYDLEAYAGKKAYIYVVAYPPVDANDVPTVMYQRSQNGSQAIVDVAERAETPEVNFTAGWSSIQEDGSDAITEDEFNEGAVEIKAAIKAIGNDELYNANLQGVVFESIDAAKAWVDKLNTAQNDTERIKLVEQLMALNNIEGTDDTAGELAFGILNMNNDTASSKNDSTRDWLYYTQALTKSNNGIGYQHAGHYVIPLVRRITTASAAAYSVWSWDTRDNYAGILKLLELSLMLRNLQ